MTDLSATTARLFADVQRSVEALDRNRSQSVRQIGNALATAHRDRRDRMADIRTAREEAGRIYAQNLKDEEACEREYATALEGIQRAIDEVAPQQMMLKAAE